MSGKNIKFDDKKKKCGFYKNKVFHTDDIDVNKIQY